MEKFFLASSFFDEIELKELLIRRYGSLDFINEFELIEFCRFIAYAKEKEREDRYYMQWCAMIPQFREYISFDDFLDRITGRNIDMRPAEDIIAEIKQLHGLEG